MDLIMTTPAEEKNMESTPTSSEDVLVVLQTENGEQIALPVSALPSDFVPGDSGQIIMVGNALDEQQQEVVVESSITGESNTENLITLQQVEHSTSYVTATNSADNEGGDHISPNNEVSIVTIQNVSSDDKNFPRTYSKNSVVKSYAPTCGKTRIYQQPQATQQVPSANHSNSGSQIETRASVADKTGDTSFITRPLDESMTNSNSQTDTSLGKVAIRNSFTPKASLTPRTKQRRKESLLLRALNEEDMKLEFQIIEEPSSFAQESEVKRKPRKEYRTKKKVRLAMEKLGKEDYADLARELEQRERDAKNKKQELLKREETRKTDETKKERPKRVEVKKEESHYEESDRQMTEEPRKEAPKRELTRRATRDKNIELATKLIEPVIQTERRTRLSNTCRVATGKNYRCNDCDFSTDRINNIILHVKESCPKLLKKI